MITIRPVRWPRDAETLSRLDTVYVTDRVYRPIRDEMSFRLVEEVVTPPLRKEYAFDPSDPAERGNWDCAIVAEHAGDLAGFAAAQHTAWNRRVALWHLYVNPPYRRGGVGTLLLDTIESFADSVSARCVWLETQNVNYPAVQFYLAAGFAFCGFDTSLYDPDITTVEEVALFFARPVRDQATSDAAR